MLVERRGGVSLKNEAPRRLAAGSFHNLVLTNAENPSNPNGEELGDRVDEAVAIKGATRVWGVGSRRNGILQDVRRPPKGGKVEELPDVLLEPTRLVSFDSRHIVEVAAGTNVSVFLDARGGSVWVSGLGTNGRLGLRRPGSREEAIQLLEDSGYSPEDRRQLGYAVPEGPRDPHCKVDFFDEGACPKWSSPAPLKVLFPPTVKVVHITCGMDHTMALTERGMVYVWGLGAFGNLGTGFTEDCWEPTELTFFRDTPCMAIAAGSKHSMAVTIEGQLYSWGHGGNGRLGLGAECAAALSPARVKCHGVGSLVDIAAADAHSAAIDASGNVYCWGAGSFGRTGHGEETDTPVVTKVSRLSGTPCRQVELGTCHSLVLTSKGLLFAWGAGEATGLFERGGSEMTTPKQLVKFESTEDCDKSLVGKVFVEIAAGDFHSVALEQRGELYSWGLGSEGRLGVGACIPEVPLMSDQLTPFQIRGSHPNADLPSYLFHGWVDFEALARKTLALRAQHQDKQSESRGIRSIHCGGMHSCVLVGGGGENQIWIWGSSEYGQIGFGESAADKPTPEFLEILHIGVPEKVEMVALGLEHCLVMTRPPSNKVYAWGRNNCGQLGLGNNTDVHVPTVIVGVTDAEMVAAGEDHSAVILENHELYTWGAAEFGKLGHGSGTTTGTQKYPRCIRSGEGSDQYKLVRCGAQHTAVLSDGGALFTFGAGWYGRLGHGDMDNQYSPKAVEALAKRNIVDVQCGSYNLCVVTDDNRLWVCGRDWSICQPDHVKRPMLMTLRGGKDLFVSQVAVGPLHTMVITTDGEVFGWGDNRHGQLGEQANDGDGRVEFPIPLGIGKVKMIAAGSAHSMALQADGDLVAWGLATGGRLGIDRKKALLADGGRYSKVFKRPEVIEPLWLAEEERDRMLAKRKRLRDAESAQSQADHDEPKKKARASLFGVLQRKLRQEPVENSLEELQKLEQRLEDDYREFIQDIWQLWDPPSAPDDTGNEAPGTEWTLQQLQNRLDRSLCRNLKCMGLGDSYPSIKTPIHPDIAAKLGQYEELLWVLQQHPCYLARLAKQLPDAEPVVVGDKDFKMELQPSMWMDTIKGIFARLRDARTRHLYMALIRVLARQEIEEFFAKNKKNKEGARLFDPALSKVNRAIKFFVEHAFFVQLHEKLFNVDDPDSLIALVLDWTFPEQHNKLDDPSGPGERTQFVFAMKDEDLLEFMPPEVYSTAEKKEQILSQLGEEFQGHQNNFFAFLGKQSLVERAEAARSKDRKHHKHSPAAVRKTFVEWMMSLSLHQDIRSIFAAVKDYVDDQVVNEETFMKLVELDSHMASEPDGHQTAEERTVLEPILTLFISGILAHLLRSVEKIMSGKQAETLAAKVRVRVRKAKEVLGRSTKDHKLEKLIEQDTREIAAKVEFNLVRLGWFLDRGLSKDFEPTQHRLADSSTFITEECLLDYVEKVAKEADDKTETDMTTDLYESHFQISEISIAMRTETLLYLSNAIWWFQDSVIALNADMFQADKLYQVLLDVQPMLMQYPVAFLQDRLSLLKGSKTGADVTPQDLQKTLKPSEYKTSRLWPPFVVLIAEQTSVTHNFTIKSRFLKTDRDLCFCRDCQAPILRSMTPQHQRGRTELRLIRLYRPRYGEEIEGELPFHTLINILSLPELPVLKSKDWISLKYEFAEFQKAAHDRITHGSKSAAQKEFKFIAILDKGKEACELVRTYGKQTSVLVRLIYESLEEREEQRRYLQAIDDKMDIIQKTQQKYKERLGEMLRSLQLVVQASEEAQLPDVFIRKAEQRGVTLKLARVEKLQRRAAATSKQLQGDYLPAATLSLGFLRSKQVVAWLQQDFPKSQYKKVTFTFSATASGDWEVVGLHKENRSTNALFTFKITSQEIDRMRCAGKTAKVSYENGLVVMNAFNLLQLLARITADAC